MILKKFPHMITDCQILLDKNDFDLADVKKINKILFPNSKKDVLKFNQQHNAYDQNSILSILKYQKENKLNNTQVAMFFKLSRNSVARWRKLYE